MNERAYRSLLGLIDEHPWEVTVDLKQEQHALLRIQHDLENVDPREITDIHDKPRVWTQHQRDRTPLAVLPSNVKFPRQECKLHPRCKATIQDKRVDPREHHTLLFTLWKACHSRRPRFDQQRSRVPKLVQMNLQGHRPRKLQCIHENQ